MTERLARSARTLVCATLLGVFGCTSSPPTINPETQTTNPAPPTVNPAPPTANPAPLTANNPIPPCVPGQVVLSTSEVSPGATHRGVQVNLGLAPGAATCQVSGYPEIEAVDGGPTLRAEHTPRGYLGGLPTDRDTPPTVVLNGGVPGTAWATVEGIAVDQDGNPCPTYAELRVTLPNASAPQPVAATLNACKVEVHPILGTEMHG
ncbi:DUF4232 domain-containing protein [Nocardia sp. NPDC049149]|uniref:DUF4232 domain-containing protein n=1 Tax=Nocardia sp. NPDC049149 TaxID=3364315 RepID=UPI003716D6CF